MTEWNWSAERRTAIGDVANQSLEYVAERLLESRKRAFEAERTAQSLQSELDALKAAHAWIKTSERMPAHGDRCLVYADFAGTVLCAIGQYIPYGASDLRPWQIQHGQERFLYAGTEAIVGWMSLPEAPK